MPLPEGIDIDKITSIALDEVRKSIKEWLQGQPTSEEALMNRITANLSKPHRSCDVGIDTEIKMISQVALLHRQGRNQTDLYGADLAVTVQIIGAENFVNTAFFQLKQSSNFRATLERKQLEDALVDERIKERSFVLFADKGRTGIRLEFVPEIVKQFDSQQKTKEFDTRRWLSFTQWLEKWLSCDTGQPSQLNDPNSIESLLQKYVVEETWIRDWSIINDSNFPETHLPARAWLYCIFAENDIYRRLKKQQRRGR